MNCLFIILVAISISEIKAALHQKLTSYFDSEVVKSFEKKWNTFAFAYENAIASTLKEDYGHKSMNVYIHRPSNPLALATGYYHTDNQVKLVFREMVLESLPNLYDVDVSFPLASNVIQVEASVSKMIIHTTYILYRDQADIIFSPAEQDPYQSSPFRFQQVRNTGDLAISLEGCSFSGVFVVTLTGNTVNIGHNELRLKDCQYNIEIYSLGTGTPPVIANYLPKGEEGLNLEHLLTRPLLGELVPKLQGAMFSEVNTSALFTKDLPEIRAKQEGIFEYTKNWIDEVVRNMNKKSIEKNMGTIDLKDFTVCWDDMFAAVPSAKSVKLSNMVLLGLDTVYASHSGGPVRLTETEILEQLRFSTLQVIGKITVDGFKDNSEFAVEISDLAVDMTINSAMIAKFEVLGWRFLEFSCPDLEYLTTESLVVGYLLNEVPKHIKSHLISVYDDKVDLAEDFVEEKSVDGTHQMKSVDVTENKQLNQEVDGKPEQLQLADDGTTFLEDHDGTFSKPADEKSPARKKNKLNRKMFTKPIHIPTKHIKFERDNRRANELAIAPKSILMENNEIQS